MKGFRDFLLRGNLIELAVAVIMGTVFAAVVKAFTDMILDVIGLFGGVPDFTGQAIAGIKFGAFLSSLLTLVLTGAVVYFLILVPYNRLAQVTKTDDPEVPASSEDLLAEIRDLLREQSARQTPPAPPGASS